MRATNRTTRRCLPRWRRCVTRPAPPRTPARSLAGPPMPRAAPCAGAPCAPPFCGNEINNLVNWPHNGLDGGSARTPVRSQGGSPPCPPRPRVRYNVTYEQLFICSYGAAMTAPRALLGEPSATALAETFKVLGDVTRVRILDAISRSELCVNDIAAVVGLSESAVSHQLRLLRGMRLVRQRRAGRMIFYALDDHHIVRLFEQGLEHVEERNGFTHTHRIRSRRQAAHPR